ncbi:MAG: hypothetical protein JW987_03115 [Anaerolineaceae bacterium]|nr:hypothetical protein [Anaerolineaceae bacterium]
MKRIVAFIERWIAKFNEVEIEVVSIICVFASMLSFFVSAFLTLETSSNLIKWLYVFGFGFPGFLAYVSAVRKTMPYMHWMNGTIARINGVLLASCCWWLSISLIIKIVFF